MKGGEIKLPKIQNTPTNIKQARINRKLRKPNEWTLEKTALKLGISINYLTRLENGHEKNPSCQLLNEFIKIYGNRILKDFLSHYESN